MEVKNKNEIEEIINITYHRLVALLADDEKINLALQNEAWELVGVLVRLLEESKDIPTEKMQKYARGIMEFAKTMYLGKIVNFPEAYERGKYRHCNDIVKLWVAGKNILEMVQTHTPANMPYSHL